MTPDTLSCALQIPIARAMQWADPLSAAMALYAIDSPARQAAFIAQVGHESGRLVYTRELWGPTSAQQRYEGRSDLGNTQPGDGFRYRGRGLIQVTGRANYQSAADALALPLIDQPELLEQPSAAALSAAWFWNAHGLNALADSGDLETITRRINGGLNGQHDRLALWNSAKSAMGVTA
ncbi:TPA: glycoside hydrolase family 19 protein [Burkholderia vietnamiensis]|nr:glycoside hydrolase family 19 protein [Burkholderia vietnamiensis]